MEDKKETAPSCQKEQPQKGKALLLISVIVALDAIGQLILAVRQRLILMEVFRILNGYGDTLLAIIDHIRKLQDILFDILRITSF